MRSRRLNEVAEVRASGSPVQGEHNDAREARDEPSLLSAVRLTEGLWAGFSNDSDNNPSVIRLA